MFAVGETVAGKYRIERELGRGGMGRVVAATHLHLNITVALKFLHDPTAAGPNVVARFLREARASAQLRNDHVCRVLDFGSEGDIPYIVMELLVGTDLGRLIRERPLGEAAAAEMVRQACEGLAEAHAAHIVHRDLKPSNLFLTHRNDGSPLVKVFDFGIAKAPEGIDVQLTQTQSVVGSPGFMSPEQLRSSKTVDSRSDIWALGVILYRLTSRRMPFKAESLTELSVQIAMDPPQPLPEVSPAFAAVVWRCLEKDPNARFQTVEELADALAPFITLDPVSRERSGPRPAPALSHLMTAQYSVRDASTLGHASAQIMAVAPSRRRPWLIAGGAIAIGLGGVLGLVTASRSDAEPTTVAPAIAPPIVVPAHVEPPAPTPPPPAPPTVAPVEEPPAPVVQAKPVVKKKKPRSAPTDRQKQIGSSRI